MKRAIATVVAVTAVLAFGATTASAHHGNRGFPLSTSKLVTAAANQLDVSRATLVAAIRSSADTTIDNSRLSQSRADDAKDEVADNLYLAYRLSRASTVAAKLGIGTTALDTAFRN